jgi:hypothetical protein
MGKILLIIGFGNNIVSVFTTPSRRRKGVQRGQSCALGRDPAGTSQVKVTVPRRCQ